MSAKPPSAWVWSSFLQSMKQICVLDVASCCFQSTNMTGTRFSNSCQKTNCLSLSGCAADIIPIWEHGQMVIDFIPGKDGTRLCLDCTQHLAVWMAELFCHFSARAHSSTHWYSCSYYPPQSAAEELWLMATVRAISQWFIKQDWHE